MAASSPRARAAGLLSLLLLFAAPTPVRSLQGDVVLVGTVLRRSEADTVPVSGTRVVLHQVGAATQGPIDSAVTAADGRYRFRFPGDTTVLYLVSARHHGIEYFSDVVVLEGPDPPGPIHLIVADTSSAAPVGVLGRYFVVGAPGSDRRRTAMDLIVLGNQGSRTRVGADSLTPTWFALLPAAAVAHRVAEEGSEISPEAVRFVGDTVFVYAPLSPGARQLLLEHTLPASIERLVVPLGEGADQIQVVTEEPGAAVAGAGATRADAQVIEGRVLERWVASGGSGEQLVVTFPGAGPGEPTAVLLLVGLTVLLLVAGLILGLRRGRGRTGGPRLPAVRTGP